MPHPASVLEGLIRVYPAANGPLRGTGLVWAHGGGFVQGDLDMPEADAVAKAFAARGATVFSVDYRLVDGNGGHFPAASDDIVRAWSWALASAASHGIDPSRLIIGGASAGGNLVTGAVLRMLGHSPAASVDAVPAGVFLAYPTLLAVQPAPDAGLRAALDADPAFDHFPPARVRSMYETYLGGPVTDDAPVTAIPGLADAEQLVGFPPTIMVNDDVDELRISGELFAATLAAADVPVALSIEPGTTHGHLNRPEEPGFDRTIERVADWITGSFL